MRKRKIKSFRAINHTSLQLTIEDSGSLSGLARCVNERAYDIIHFSGHASIEDQTGVLFFENDMGLREDVTAKLLLKTLKSNDRLPEIVFLSACRTAQNIRFSNTLSSLAVELAMGGVRNVIGWTHPVSDHASIIAADVFYQGVSAGCSIAEVLSEVRYRLFINPETKEDWPFLNIFGDLSSIAERAVQPATLQDDLKTNLKQKTAVGNLYPIFPACLFSFALHWSSPIIEDLLEHLEITSNTICTKRNYSLWTCWSR